MYIFFFFYIPGRCPDVSFDVFHDYHAFQIIKLSSFFVLRVVSDKTKVITLSKSEKNRYTRWYWFIQKWFYFVRRV